MADYTSQFSGPEIDARLAKVPQLESGLAGKQATLVSGTNIKTLNGESVLGSGNITIQGGDPDAVKYVAQTLTESQKAQARANIDAASLSDIADMDFVTATTLPTASASTMGHIYLIGPDANDNYDRYFTQESGGSYSWVPLGSTQIDLSTYATQEEVSQLEAEVHHLSGKYYGVFEMPSELPEGDVAGYAFVGETMPLALYNFDGEDWGDTGIAVSGITGPQGPQGIQGIQGIQGLPGVTSAVLTIDNETGTPYGEISVVNGVLSIALHNIKGLQGNSGYTGAAGELQIVNNTYQGGATSALSAEMGKQLEENKVSGRIENQQDNDFAIADENDFDIVQFKNGEVKTKNFDSAKSPYSETTEDGADFEVNDANGFAILRCIGGHIKTKNFDSSTAFASPLAGKKVAFLGDSITAGYNASPTTKRYSTVFCELAGCTEKNLGVASTAIANNTLNGLGSSRFITRATSANLSNQDLIFVFGGTNDFSYDSKPIGEPFNIATITTDTYIGDKKKTAPSDTDTFSGALHELILQIRSVAPSAQLVFITPLTRGRYNSGRPTSAECNQHGDFLQDFTDTIKTVCSFYSVPVVDMGVMMNQFWANDWNGTFGSYDSDGIHPNNAGHERIAKLLYKWVNNNLIF